MDELTEVIELVTKRGDKLTLEMGDSALSSVKITLTKGDKKITWLTPWIIIKQSNLNLLAYEIAKSSDLLNK